MQADVTTDGNAAAPAGPPPPVLAATMDCHPPSNLRAGWVTTPDGVRLRYAMSRPTHGRVRGTVLLLHGRAEFIERYYETITDLDRRGFAVLTFDWRGQGGSQRVLRDPRRGHVRSFADYDTDLETMVHQVMLPDLPGPYVALGHSTGGQILARVLRRHVVFGCGSERAVSRAGGSAAAACRGCGPRAGPLDGRICARLFTGAGQGPILSGAPVCRKPADVGRTAVQPLHGIRRETPGTGHWRAHHRLVECGYGIDAKLEANAQKT